MESLVSLFRVSTSKTTTVWRRCCRRRFKQICWSWCQTLMEFTTSRHGKRARDCWARKLVKLWWWFESSTNFSILDWHATTTKKSSLERNRRLELVEWTQSWTLQHGHLTEESVLSFAMAVKIMRSKRSWADAKLELSSPKRLPAAHPLSFWRKTVNISIQLWPNHEWI